MQALLAAGLAPDKDAPHEVALDHLQETRRKCGSKPAECISQFLDALAKELPSEVEAWEKLRGRTLAAISALVDDAGTTCGLFVAPNDRGIVRRLKVVDVRTNEHLLVTDLQRDSQNNHGAQSDKQACYAALMLAHHKPEYSCDYCLDGEHMAMQGSSNGLALAVALLSKIGHVLPLDPYTGFTGELDQDGNVRSVDGLQAKLTAAVEFGLRRVFVPSDNTLPANLPEGCKIIVVRTLTEVCDRLNRPFASVPLGLQSEFARKKVALRDVLQHNGFQITEKSLNDGKQHQLVAHHVGGGQKVTISGYPTTGKWHIASAPPSIKAQLDGILQRPGEATVVQEMDVVVPHTYKAPETRVVTDRALQERIKRTLSLLGAWQQKPTPHTEYAMEMVTTAGKAVVTQYQSGKLVIGGQGHPLQQTCTRVDELLGYTPSVKEHYTETNPPATAKVVAGEVPFPYIGTDESGKGDYFGPLVIAGAYVDAAALSLSALGVRDSKKVRDGQVLEMAPRVQDILGRSRFKIITIPPETYNKLYREFQSEGKNLNLLLAWGHARALDDLVAQTGCDTAVADQFGDEAYIRSKLMANARAANLRLIQKPKAEIEIGVAAASILARAQFLQVMDSYSKLYGQVLPKGASDEVIQAARKIVARSGQGELAKVAKLHFKTTQQVGIG